MKAKYKVHVKVFTLKIPWLLSRYLAYIKTKRFACMLKHFSRKRERERKIARKRKREQ